MNGNVHIWLIEDAIRFVKAQGKNREKDAFQAWESSYGGGDIDTVPYYQTRLVDIVGRESQYTDKYHDLAIYLDDILGWWQDNITEYDGHIFTALDHFLSVPWVPSRWWRSDGYQYYRSSRSGNDSRAMTGKVDTKDAEVDNEHSPIVSRCGFAWTGSSSDWSHNWAVDIRGTYFIPVSALGYYYYKRLLKNYFSYVDVNGERYDKIVGMFLLGPVCHALADACVPQHTISAMGYKHQEWENTVETWAKKFALEDFGQVRNILDNHMKSYIYTGGELKGRFAIDYVISELCGWHTYVKFLQLNGLNGIDQVNNGFWENYMGNLNKLKSDCCYFYNLAIAATVRVITESCYDVIATGGGSNPKLKINGVSKYQPIGELPRRERLGNFHFPLPSDDLIFMRADTMLGFRPDNWRPATNILFAARTTLTKWSTGEVDKQVAIENLTLLEDEFYHEFKKADARGLDGFEPPETLDLPKQTSTLRSLCGLPEVSKNLQSGSSFGLASFRSPTEAEIVNDAAFAKYLKAAKANEVNAKLLELTRCVAYHRYLMDKETNRIRRRKVKSAFEQLKKVRETIMRSKRLPIDRSSAVGIDRQVINIQAARTENGVSIAH